jgi:pyruvate dehydrogenase E2 component (dihydrolipoyllysine-residue acetyltransferase)
MALVTMPKAGQTMEEGTILRWCRQEGEYVAKGQILLEIDTDKATVEVEAPEGGVVRKILVQAGQAVPVLVPIAVIADASADITGELAEAAAHLSAFAPAATPAAAVPEEAVPIAGGLGSATLATGPGESAGRVKASPAARRAAREKEIDVAAAAPGSGPEGRILSTDVARVPGIAPAATAPLSSASSSTGGTRRPLAGMRRAIARGMTASKQNIPHFYMKLTINAGPLHAFYRSEKQRYPCTINDIVTLGCARVVREFPAFRSRIEGDDVIEYPAASIGVAVGMDEGLIVPVVVGADNMSLQQLAVETQRIVEAARQGKVTAMGQGVFTVSNLGGFGVEEFSAIINPPESAILAVGTMREAVIVKDETLRPGRIMTLTLSADHRLIDGLMAARFLKRLKELLESPASL